MKPLGHSTNSKEYLMSQQFSSRREILQNWNPEDNSFWESYGKTIAKENLIVSTAALTLAFCV